MCKPFLLQYRPSLRAGDCKHVETSLYFCDKTEGGRRGDGPYFSSSQPDHGLPPWRFLRRSHARRSAAETAEEKQRIKNADGEQARRHQKPRHARLTLFGVTYFRLWPPFRLYASKTTCSECFVAGGGGCCRCRDRRLASGFEIRQPPIVSIIRVDEILHSPLEPPRQGSVSSASTGERASMIPSKAGLHTAENTDGAVTEREQERRCTQKPAQANGSAGGAALLAAQANRTRLNTSTQTGRIGAPLSGLRWVCLARRPRARRWEGRGPSHRYRPAAHGGKRVQLLDQQLPGPLQVSVVGHHAALGPVEDDVVPVGEGRGGENMRRGLAAQEQQRRRR